MWSSSGCDGRPLPLMPERCRVLLPSSPVPNKANEPEPPFNSPTHHSGWAGPRQKKHSISSRSVHASGLNSRRCLVIAVLNRKLSASGPTGRNLSAQAIGLGKQSNKILQSPNGGALTVDHCQLIQYFKSGSRLIERQLL